jgi:hypothetical protein
VPEMDPDWLPRLLERRRGAERERVPNVIAGSSRIKPGDDN